MVLKVFQVRSAIDRSTDFFDFVVSGTSECYTTRLITQGYLDSFTLNVTTPRSRSLF